MPTECKYKHLIAGPIMIKKSMQSEMKSIIKYVIDFESFIKSRLIFTLGQHSRMP